MNISFWKKTKKHTFLENILLISSEQEVEIQTLTGKLEASQAESSEGNKALEAKLAQREKQLSGIKAQIVAQETALEERKSEIEELVKTICGFFVAVSGYLQILRNCKKCILVHRLPNKRKRQALKQARKTA